MYSATSGQISQLVFCNQGVHRRLSQGYPRVLSSSYTREAAHKPYKKRKNAMPMLPYDTAGKTLTFDFHTLSLG